MEPTAREQDLFLTCSAHLEQALLPRLSATGRLRLGLTCKAFQEWIRSTPLSLWQASSGPAEVCCKLSATSWPSLTSVASQDAPIDATAGFLSSLSSTERLVAALQSSLTARHNVSANSHVRREAVPIPEQLTGRLHQHFEWVSLKCSEVALSCCGQWAAVVLEAEQKCWFHHKERDHLRLPFGIKTFELVLYSILNGWQQQASFNTGSSAPIMQWGPSKPVLSVALLPRVRIRLWGFYDCVHMAPELSAAFVYDAGADEELSAGPHVSESIQRLERVKTRNMIWSPDCRLLMVYKQWTGLHVQGCLELLDVAGDCVLARSEVLRDVDSWNTFAGVAWHPSSKAIIVSHDMQLRKAVSFREAGIISSTLPTPLHPFCDGPVFSPDGRLLLTVWDEADEVQSLGRHPVLSCSVDELQVTFAKVDISCRFDRSKWYHWDDPIMQWLPDSTGLLVKPPLCGSVVHLPCMTLDYRIEGQAHISPTGRHCVGASLLREVSGRQNLIVIDMECGAQMWSSATARPTCGSQLGCHALLTSDEAELCRECHGWLPSGLGIVCSTSKRKQLAQPCIHVYYFA